MSEEEKETIKWFRDMRTKIDENYILFDEPIDITCGQEMIKRITILLNLVDKLNTQNNNLNNNFSSLMHNLPL